MRIGIDAKWYFQGPPSGKRVVRALVDELLRLDKENEYFIILNRRHRKEVFLPARKNIHRVYVWAGNNLLSNVFVVAYYASLFKLDVVLYQNFISLFGRGRKIAYIHDVLFLSNPEYYTVYERLYFSPLKFLTRRADAVVTVSDEEKKRLLHFSFADATRIAVAHHGVDNSFQPLEKYNTDLVAEVKKRHELPNRFLLYVGRLNLRKNIDNLLKSIPLLKEKNIPLVIVGSSNWKESNHEQTIRELGIQERVLFRGSIDQDLGVVYALSTLFCFPSFAESFGLPPLEAMASGVPVVVSNTTSLPEVCGDAGNYVPPDNPVAIAAMIDSLLTNDQLYRQRRAMGLNQASKFTWGRSAQTVKQIIETCVKNSIE